MVKQLLNSVIAKYFDLSVSRRSIICLSRNTDKSYSTSSNNCQLFLSQKWNSCMFQIFLRTARCSYEAIIALALQSAILIVGNADIIVTTRRTVRLTGTLCEIIIDILALLQSTFLLLFSIKTGFSGVY